MYPNICENSTIYPNTPPPNLKQTQMSIVWRGDHHQSTPKKWYMCTSPREIPEISVTFGIDPVPSRLFGHSSVYKRLGYKMSEVWTRIKRRRIIPIEAKIPPKRICRHFPVTFFYSPFGVHTQKPRDVPWRFWRRWGRLFLRTRTIFQEHATTNRDLAISPPLIFVFLNLTETLINL